METNKMSNLNRIFTRNMLRHFIDGKVDNVYSSVVRRYISNADQKNNRELISEIYCELKNNYRNEYFYKNTLLNKLLLGVHSVNTTAALTEVAIAKSKADFVLINGKAVVYEIKTELDNLDRLNSQIDDYYKAFDHVATVTYEKNLQQLQKVLGSIDKPVGIYVLRKNGKLGTIQKPQRYIDGLDKEVIFKLLRKSEYEDIIAQRYGYLPEVTQFKYYSACKKMFLQIPIEESYLLVLRILKRRMQIEKERFVKIPYELKFLAYFMELTFNDYQKLEAFLEHQYGGA
ncbi:MAG: sce7726 family protein [Bacteroidales bacterium]|nr:sce7726 family protein [Bacteroidales bacterium]MCM1416056.1 sce7726 family protein [bacterium]MCM1424174.1 sce7726 family protein [bacterium]